VSGRMSASGMHVDQVWRYPVKSMVGERVPAAKLGQMGMIGDRWWAARDEERGGIRGAKKIGELMTLSARFVDEIGGPVEITLPDGSVVRTDDDDCNEQVSTALDHKVTLWPLRPPTDLEHYRRGAADSDDIMEELRQIFGREIDEPLPDLSVFPPEIIEFESPPGSYVDAFPVLLMTTSALSSLEAALPDSVIDVKRFRPNLVVATDEPGHPEFDWIGKRISVGETVLEVYVACPRCVMVTREIDEHVPADRQVLRYIVRELEQNVGVYATVIEGGEIREGDPVVVL
jgi:uncharacterized protein YcbX